MSGKMNRALLTTSDGVPPVAYNDNISIRIPSQSTYYSDGDMAGFMGQYKKSEAAERKSALKKKIRNMKIGTVLQFGLTFVCLFHGVRYALWMNDQDGGTRIGGWQFTLADHLVAVPSISLNAAMMIVGVLCLIAGGTYFAARLPELYAKHKTGERGAKYTIAMFVLAICISCLVSVYSSQSIIQFSHQAATDVSETSGDKATAAMALKEQYAKDLRDLNSEIWAMQEELERALKADDNHVKRAALAPKSDYGWLMNTTHANAPRKPIHDRIVSLGKTITGLKAERTTLKRGQREATATYQQAIEAPNSIDKSMQAQAEFYGAGSPEAMNLYIAQALAIVIEFFRITLSLSSQTSLIHAIVGFAMSEHQRRSKEAEAEWEAEERQRRYEEATLAPIRAKEEAHLRAAEAHAERIRARGRASVEAIEADEEPDDLVFNTDASQAIEEAPEDDDLSIPPMPSQKAPTGVPVAFSATMRVDSAPGYDELSDFYQDAVRRAEQSWRSGSHQVTHGGIEREYGIKSNKARIVFLQWLEQAGRATSRETPTGRKYTKTRIA